jgi:hypothetical protein
MNVLKNEDWLAVILGFIIMGAVVFGLIKIVPW